MACYNFTNPHFGREAGACGVCRREQPLKDGYCRLCWCQAALDREVLATDARSANVLAPYVPRVRHHQLFLAGMTKRASPRIPRRFEKRLGAKGRPLKPPPPPVARPIAEWVQPPLFEIGARDYRAHRVDLRSGPPPENPWLTWALYLAHQMAEARGWSAVTRGSMQRTLVKLLSGHSAGELIRASDARIVALAQYIHLAAVLELLEQMDVLTDDLPTTFDSWLQAKTDTLAPAIAAEIRDWARTLRYGAARSLPRDPGTAHGYVIALLPALTDWSARYHHLREVTTADVRALLAPLTSHRKDTALSAVRSLFRWAKAERRIFRNPARGVKGTARNEKVWQPLSQQTLEAAVAAAKSPQARLYLALAAIHGARPGHIRALHLDEIDLAARRISIGGIERPLDELTHRVITQWLEHRRGLWPATANPDLVISKESALGYGPVSHVFVRELRPTGTTFEQLRIDRRLEEALASGGDPSQFLAVFGGSEVTAVRYATNARLLLDDAHETHPGPSPRNSGIDPAAEPEVS
jgi:integrase